MWWFNFILEFQWYFFVKLKITGWNFGNYSFDDFRARFGHLSKGKNCRGHLQLQIEVLIFHIDRGLTEPKPKKEMISWKKSKVKLNFRFKCHFKALWFKGFCSTEPKSPCPLQHTFFMFNFFLQKYIPIWTNLKWFFQFVYKSLKKH